MRITKVSVKKLFGIFDHEIPLNQESRITIIHGPNGVGKTTLLAMIDAFFKAQYEIFSRIPYERMRFDLASGARLEIGRQENAQANGKRPMHIDYWPAHGRAARRYVLDSGAAPEWLRRATGHLHTKRICTQRLLRQTGAAAFDFAANFDCAARPPMAAALCQQKFATLARIINRRYKFKKLVAPEAGGFFIAAEDGLEIPLDYLSSGEKLQLILFYELLFHSEAGSLLMIDNPELSLHVSWQRNFLQDIQEIVRLGNFDVLIATHSPQIIHDKWDWMVDLHNPEAERADETFEYA